MRGTRGRRGDKCLPTDGKEKTPAREGTSSSLSLGLSSEGQAFPHFLFLFFPERHLFVRFFSPAFSERVQSCGPLPFRRLTVQGRVSFNLMVLRRVPNPVAQRVTRLFGEAGPEKGRGATPVCPAKADKEAPEAPGEGRRLWEQRGADALRHRGDRCREHFPGDCSLPRWAALFIWDSVAPRRGGDAPPPTGGGPPPIVTSVAHVSRNWSRRASRLKPNVTGMWGGRPVRRRAGGLSHGPIAPHVAAGDRGARRPTHDLRQSRPCAGTGHSV